MKKIKIGGAISAEQVEGRRGFSLSKTVWDRYFENSPGDFYNMEGPDKAIDFITYYKGDVKLFKEAGLEELRISLSWAKIFPDESWMPNQHALDYYHSLIDEIRGSGIDVILTLYHFDTPLWVFDQAEMTNRKFIDLFYKYAKFVIENFNSKVKTIVTFNEPVGQIERGYLKGVRHWPLKKDINLFVQANFNVIIAHKKVAQLIADKYSHLQSAIVLNLRLSIPEFNNEECLKASKKYDILFTDFMLYPIANREIHNKLLPLLEEMDVKLDISENDMQLIKTIKTDLIGINYYRPRRILPGKTNAPKPFNLFQEQTDFSKYRYNKDRGMEIFPEGMEIICESFVNNYNNHKFFISENGMGIMEDEEAKFIDDRYRIDYITEHVKALEKGVEKGANCVAYHIWSPIDNWSWGNGFKNRYGLISVNTKTMKRTPKASFYKFKDIFSKK